MTRIWIVAASAAAIAGCGGGSDPPTTATTGSSARPSSTPSAPRSPRGLTPPGTHLTYGKTATVDWVPASLSIKGIKKLVKLQVSVDSVTKGSKSDLKAVDLDADQKGATPYYVRVTIRDLKGRGPAKDDPDVALHAYDDRDQEQGSVTFIGDFKPCADKDAPQPFGPGKRYSSCLTYFMTGGGSIKEVRWRDGPSDKYGVSAYFNKPVVWSAG